MIREIVADPESFAPSDRPNGTRRVDLTFAPELDQLQMSQCEAEFKRAFETASSVSSLETSAGTRRLQRPPEAGALPDGR